MLNRICEICGRTVRHGKPCVCRAMRHRRYDERWRDKDKAAFYHGKAWQRTAEAARKRAQYVDEVIYAETGRLVPGAIVHHIEPIDENPMRKLDMENLIFVSAGKKSACKTGDAGKTDGDSSGKRRGGGRSKKFWGGNIKPRPVFFLEKMPEMKFYGVFEIRAIDRAKEDDDGGSPA